MDHIFYPTFYAVTDSGSSKTSKSLVELTNWAKETSAERLMVRRFNPDGSINLRPLFVYELQNGRLVRVA